MVWLATEGSPTASYLPIPISDSVPWSVAGLCSSESNAVERGPAALRCSCGRLDARSPLRRDVREVRVSPFHHDVPRHCLDLSAILGTQQSREAVRNRILLFLGCSASRAAGVPQSPKRGSCRVVISNVFSTNVTLHFHRHVRPVLEDVALSSKECGPAGREQPQIQSKQK